MNKANWKSEIVRLAMVKQSIAAADQSKVLPWALPNVAAEETEIIRAEQAIQQPLACGYREFLSYANGWTGFCISTDLFGTNEITSDRAQQARARPDLLAYCHENKLDASTCIIIGSSLHDLNLFVMFREESEAVIWLCGDEVDRYESFFDFFVAMISYNEQVLCRLIDNP